MNKIVFVVVGGFLGAGKTTALVWLAHSLEAMGKRCAVVMNDQGEQLVDTAFGRAEGLSVAEVTGGCFCCRFDDLVTTTIGLVERGAIEIVLAEAVGSCTDLTATVIRPLRAYFGERFDVAPLSVLVEPARLRELRPARGAVGGLMPYLFDKQLEDAQLLVLTKQDLVDQSDRAELISALEWSFPSAEVLSVSARTGSGMDTFRDRVLLASGRTARSSAYSIDYATYAQAEAELAWLNAQVTITQSSTSTSGGSADWLRAFMSELSNRCARRGLWIGHVKAHVALPTGGSKASVLRAGEAPTLDLEDARPFVEARLLVNARVRGRPGDLEEVVLASLQWVDENRRTTSSVDSVRSFSPAPPRPTHRLLSAAQ